MRRSAAPHARIASTHENEKFLQVRRFTTTRPRQRPISNPQACDGDSFAPNLPIRLTVDPWRRLPSMVRVMPSTGPDPSCKTACLCPSPMQIQLNPGWAVMLTLVFFRPPTAASAASKARKCPEARPRADRGQPGPDGLDPAP